MQDPYPNLSLHALDVLEEMYLWLAAYGEQAAATAAVTAGSTEPAMPASRDAGESAAAAAPSQVTLAYIPDCPHIRLASLYLLYREQLQSELLYSYGRMV